VTERRGGFAIESELDIGRPQAEVFEYLADTDSFTALDKALVEFEPQGPVHGRHERPLSPPAERPARAIDLARDRARRSQDGSPSKCMGWGTA
jgi:hypothetical protein